ncbi:hypothetical protein LRY65_04575 [Candidatus Woesebacteria bacterium]|nr:hypothetical protein [Candidatus Woesebacteria bacterium]MCD8507603.1 hypothetical protein [Candidatus Woesebacteria bacterium]MCD8527447.1 hypothetical protein [Candidatus Woesebacteria bacterium]MCD8546189.1 hypothetical protein [Candidatus Woesebacteria bacterium]
MRKPRRQETVDQRYLGPLSGDQKLEYTVNSTYFIAQELQRNFSHPLNWQTLPAKTAIIYLGKSSSNPAYLKFKVQESENRDVIGHCFVMSTQRARTHLSPISR